MVTENTAAYKVLEKFKETGIHYAVVVDEYGSLQGLVAMDDVMDVLIGDATEYNQTDYQIIQRDENSWLTDAQLPFYQFAEYFKLEKEENPVYSTLASLIIHHLNHIPTAGKQLKWKKFTFVIVDMDGLRIDKVLIKKK